MFKDLLLGTWRVDCWQSMDRTYHFLYPEFHARHCINPITFLKMHSGNVYFHALPPFPFASTIHRHWTCVSKLIVRLRGNSLASASRPINTIQLLSNQLHHIRYFATSDGMSGISFEMWIKLVWNLFLYSGCKTFGDGCRGFSCSWGCAPYETCDLVRHDRQEIHI